jgi:hypothetical protein
MNSSNPLLTPDPAFEAANPDDNSASDTLDYLLSPLLDALSKLCPDDGRFSFTNAFLPGPRIDEGTESLIEIDGCAGSQVFRAAAALLVASDSQARIEGDGATHLWPMWTPIHFAVVKRRYGLGPQDLMHYIHCYPHPDDAFDETDIKRQVDALVAYLSDPENIVELTPEERMRLF